MAMPATMIPTYSSVNTQAVPKAVCCSFIVANVFLLERVIVDYNQTDLDTHIAMRHGGVAGGGGSFNGGSFNGGSFNGGSFNGGSFNGSADSARSTAVVISHASIVVGGGYGNNGGSFNGNMGYPGGGGSFNGGSCLFFFVFLLLVPHPTPS